ncbi:MAG: GDP-mannose 4,6-dehydratase, partial [Alistipes sp.]
PDMAPMLFTKAILAGESIKVFNNGDLSRDFTYVDDIVEGVVRVIDHAPNAEDPAALYNIGCGHPMQLMDFIHTLEESLGKKAQMTLLPMQQGDVYTTYADTTKLKTQVDYQPTTSLKDGIQKFVQWYKNNQF